MVEKPARNEGSWWSPNTLPGLRNVDDVIARLAVDPGFEQAVKKDPARALAQVNQRALYTDPWVYRGVIVALGLTIVIAVIGAIILPLEGVTETPQVLTALGSAAVGALAGLLAPPPTG